MAKLSFDINADALKKELNAATSKVGIFAERQVRNEVRAIMKESLLQVPKDTGALSRSAYEKITRKGFGVEAEFGYGGDNAQTNVKTGTSTEDYMVKIHEDLSLHHPNGKAKFLEDPARAAEEKIQESISKKFANALKGLFSR